jgi:hypothetical protein
MSQGPFIGLAVSAVFLKALGPRPRITHFKISKLQKKVEINAFFFLDYSKGLLSNGAKWRKVEEFKKPCFAGLHTTPSTTRAGS